MKTGGGTTFIIALAGLLTACSHQPGGAPASIFPATGEVQGWSRVGETRTFEADNLWQYVDGDADRYIQAGVARTVTADYRFRDKLDAVADVHIMKAPEGAKKIFEAEPSAGSQPIDLGEGGRSYGASVTFHQGPHFVRLVAYQEGPDIGKALAALGRAMAERLKTNR